MSVVSVIKIAVVLGGAADARCHRGLAAVDAVLERESFLAAGRKIVLDQAVEQEPARLARRCIRVAVLAARIAAVDHAELGDGCPTTAPRVLFPVTRLNRQRCSLACKPVEGEKPECLLPLVTCQRIDGCGLTFEEPVEDDLVAVLVGVGEVQHERRVGLEPPDVVGTAAPRDDGEP